MVNKLKRLLFLCTVAYVVVVSGVGIFQRSFMYHPQESMQQPAAYGLSAQEVMLRAKDKTLVKLWFQQPQEGKPLIVFFHGNGGNLSYRVQKFKEYMATGMGLLAVSYRGYGGSSGKPDETGIYQDARAALDYAQIKGHSGKKIILYGESLGTGVAVQMAAERRVGLVVLESPYTSTLARAQEIYPWIPVSLLMRDQFKTIQKIRDIQAPLLIFHNKGDGVIPIAHGRRVYAMAMPPKKAIWFVHNGHTDFNWQRLATEVLEYYRHHDKG